MLLKVKSPYSNSIPTEKLLLLSVWICFRVAKTMGLTEEEPLVEID